MKKFILSLAAVAMVVLSGCSHKEYLYLTDMVDDANYEITNKHQTRIEKDDRLRIKVSSKNPELSAPFNVSTGYINLGDRATATAAVSGDGNIYRVNDLGDIQFPVLGEIHVTGMSLNQAAEDIRQKIIAGGYIKDPIVTVDFANFRYSVLGAVNGNGIYTAETDKVTILEAIAKAGDLANNADLQNIAVIRESDGKRKVYNLDITKTNIFDSPAFYLAQNDIVYARPRKPRSEGESRTLQYAALLLSLCSCVTSIIWVTKR